MDLVAHFFPVPMPVSLPGGQQMVVPNADLVATSSVVASSGLVYGLPKVVGEFWLQQAVPTFKVFKL